MRLYAQYMFSENQANKEISNIKKKPGMAGARGKSKYYILTNYTLHNSVSPSLSLALTLPLSLSHSISPISITHSPSLSLSLTDQQHRQQQSMKTKHTKTKVSQWTKVAQRRQK